MKVKMRNEFAILGVVPEPSKRSKEDMKYSTALNRWFLRPIGIWPTKSDTRVSEKILSEFCVFLFCSLMFCGQVPCEIHTFIKEQDLTVKMKIVGPLSFCFLAITKYFFLLARRRDIRHCLEHIDIDWRRVNYLDDREIMLVNAKHGRYIVLVCAVFMYSGGSFYHTIRPWAAGSSITPDNITIRPLAYAAYDPLFSTQTTPIYEIIFTLQCLSGFFNYSVTTGSCSLAAVFVLHTCGQLKIVMSRLESFVKGRIDGYRDVDDRMAEIVELHLRALGFVDRVEDLLNEVCLIEFAGSTMSICFLGYYFMVEFEQSEAIATLTYCVLLLSFIFNIFIFCYIGEMLTQQGDKLGRTAYMINWYELPAKKSRSLILLLAMSKHPATITAGKMTELSFRSFSAVLRTAVAYLNFLRTLVI